MANHAIHVTPNSRTISSSRSCPRDNRNNLVIISPEQLGQMELLPDRPSRIPPLAPARPPPVAPGSAVRIHSSHQQSSSSSSSSSNTTTRRILPLPPPATSPLAVPRMAAPTLPSRSSVTTTSSSLSSMSSTSTPSSNNLLLLPSLASTTTNGTSTSNRSLMINALMEPEVITLSQPRPDGERVRNEYIDTPLKGGLASRATSTTPLHAETHIHISGSPHDHLALVSPLGSQSSSNKTSSTKSLPFNHGSGTGSAISSHTPLTSPSLKRLQSTRRSLPITKQPAFLTKDSSRSRDANSIQSALACCPSTSTSANNSTSSTTRMVFSSAASAGSQSISNGGDSIICPDCDRCRCQSCRTPRPLPSKWLCGDKCLCSAESCVDYASCLCCVKGLFYHCGSTSDDDDQDIHRRSRSGSRCHNSRTAGGYHQNADHARVLSSESTSSSSAAGGAVSASCADAPCSCVPSHHRMARWGCLASLTLVLPCLLCYWPLQGGVKVVEMCYQRCTRHGCRCDHHHHQQQQHQPSLLLQQQQQQQQRRIVTTTTSSSLQQQQLNSGSNKKTAIVVQPLPSSGKRLLDI